MPSTPDYQVAAAEKVVLKGENFDVILLDDKPAIRINVGGHIIVMTAEKWHEAARQHPSEKVLPLAYCILNRDGKMFWSESCIFAESNDGADELEAVRLDDPDAGWHLAPFYAAPQAVLTGPEAPHMPLDGQAAPSHRPTAEPAVAAPHSQQFDKQQTSPTAPRKCLRYTNVGTPLQTCGGDGKWCLAEDVEGLEQEVADWIGRYNGMNVLCEQQQQRASKAEAALSAKLPSEEAVALARQSIDTAPGQAEPSKVLLREMGLPLVAAMIDENLLLSREILRLADQSYVNSKSSKT